MNSAPAPLLRAQLALDLLSAARPTLPPIARRELPPAAELAKEIAAHSAELSRALATMVRSGDASAGAARIASSLAAQHDIVRRIHRLPTRPSKS